MSPARAAALGLVVALGAGACSSEPGRACTLIGGRNVLTVSVAPGVRADLATLEVELCQKGGCGQVTFAAKPPDPRFDYVQRGVTLGEDGAFTIDATALGRTWDPGAPARVDVRGVSGSGRTVARRTESFDFERSYPNGKACDVTPYLSHTTRVGAQDRTSR